MARIGKIMAAESRSVSLEMAGDEEWQLIGHSFLGVMKIF